MLKVKCPTCHREVEWSENSPWRPYCSERCKLIDLGAWANGDYVISGKPIEADDDIDLPIREEPSLPDIQITTKKDS